MVVILTSQRKKPRYARLQPKPYQQGDLDALCGVYAIINGLRNATSTLGQADRVSWDTLYELLLMAVDQEGGLVEVMCRGIGRRVFAHCLDTARHYLSQRHGLALHVTRPWIGRSSFQVRKALLGLQGQLELPGHTALLLFDSSLGKHWSVIQQVDQDSVYLSDSDGYRVRPLSAFMAGSKARPRSIASSLVNRNSLVLLSLNRER
jgi:hypothetical protein